ncbi:NAD-dependent protein deacylase [Lacticaseibacillus camelliae]|uniref:protein acetyllysine N-acetyltransferase n=1 Tax=Lacticaseibacillus camelliae DSM 22697 = JCM 13995 TaxID=1423730 RepID=A0A0R2FM07_9LACO|nr:NAD-dependent protein deacylase [Lacticaseibacillus camelliae]KRN25914.1 NAD-dependent deacetylase [Lacticaseibacillus camelliae DSM 22697 = JCM 13995]
MFDLKQAIDDAQFVTFMTGAGVSTASGIPDYRSKGGLYSDLASPEEALSDENLRDHHEAFHDWVVKKMYYPDAKPNVIHEKMAAITNRKGAIVTQNVDGLHQKGGAKHVIEFHGNLYNIFCQKCGQHFDYQTYLKADVHAQDGGILRPGIVLYGEPINPDVVERAIAAISRADLLVVVGTSFQVYPFAGLIGYAKPGAVLAAVNREPIALPAGAHMVVGDAVAVFSKL